MSVTYRIVNKDGVVVYNTQMSPCFSSIPGMSAKCRALTNILIYDVKVKGGLTQEEALNFLADLKTMGFHFEQTPKDILENGYHISFSKLARAKGIILSELGGNLTIIRYLEEFSQVISKYLNILDIDPKFDKWKALQLAHHSTVEGKSKHAGYFGDGHILLTPWGNAHKYKSMDEISKDFDKSKNLWSGQAGYRINQAYGHKRGTDDMKNLLIRNNDDLQKWDKAFSTK